MSTNGLRRCWCFAQRLLHRLCEVGDYLETGAMRQSIFTPEEFRFLARDPNRLSQRDWTPKLSEVIRASISLINLSVPSNERLLPRLEVPDEFHPDTLLAYDPNGVAKGIKWYPNNGYV
jgi:hypothetical protein